MKFNLLLFIIQVLYFCNCTNPLYLLNVNSKSTTMTYLTPLTTNGYNEYVRVDFEVKLTSQLSYSESATAICVRTNDSTYTVAAGNKAFGISFICTVSAGCSNSTSLNVAFYSSVITSINPTTWLASGTDYSSANVGSTSQGTGTNFDTRYGFTQSQATSSNIPLDSETVYLRCFGLTNVNKDSARLDYSLDLSTWEQSTQTYEVTKSEYKCESGVSCDGQNIYIHFFALLALLALFLIV